MCMLLDVLAAIADLRTHQLAHGAVRHHGVLDRHALQNAGLRVHRRRGKLLGVHLAQTLVALDGIALALFGNLAVLALPSSSLSSGFRPVLWMVSRRISSSGWRPLGYT